MSRANPLLVYGGFICVVLAIGAYAAMSYAGRGISEISARDIPSGSLEYRSEEFGFSLLYPASLSVREEVNAARSRTIVFEDKEKALTFQLFFVPFREPRITEERLKMDVPSGVIRDPETLSIDDGEATAFTSQDIKLGEMAEIWILRNGYLYEFTAPLPLKEWLRYIVETTQFIPQESI